jgi:hypothetical protein
MEGEGKGMEIHKFQLKKIEGTEDLPQSSLLQPSVIHSATFWLISFKTTKEEVENFRKIRIMSF